MRFLNVILIVKLANMMIFILNSINGIDITKVAELKNGNGNIEYVINLHNNAFR